MKLIEVTDAKTRRQFLDMANGIYRNHPNWIRPLDKDIEAVFDPAQNNNFKHGEAIRWVLQGSKGQIIGRVAAFINHKNSLSEGGIKAGGMGFFECVDDQEAADLLFDTCKNWLQKRGIEAMDGPINFGQRDRFWGLLVDGFHQPNYCMFYHPPYYRQLFEKYGFEVYFKQYTYYRDMRTELGSKYTERYEKVMQDPEYSFTTANLKNPEKLAQDLHYIYKKAWGSHADVGELKLETLREMVKEMMPILDERIIWFGYYKDEPICFYVMLPELNHYFRHLNGKFNLAAKLKFLFYKTFFPTKTAFGLLFGVIPEFQKKGVEAAMVKKASEVVLHINYEHLEMNWIGDFNPKMMLVTRLLGATVRKTHHTYRYLFDRTIPFERYPVID